MSGMTAEAYRTALSRAVERRAAEIASRLGAVLHDLPQQATGFDIGIHPDQDQEGFVSVWVHAVGPDSHVIDRAIADHRLLFDISMDGEGRMSHGLPVFEPHAERFAVGDTQVDTIAQSLRAIWTGIDGGGFDRPVHVFGGDGFGTIGRLRIHPGDR